MQVKHARIVTIGVTALIWLSPVSQAAPLPSVVGVPKAATTVGSGVEKAAYRVCWLKYGIRNAGPVYYYPR
jgi:hypothetical protein